MGSFTGAAAWLYREGRVAIPDCLTEGPGRSQDSASAQAFGRKKEAEQDAARLALLHLQKTKARRPQAGKSCAHVVEARMLGRMLVVSQGAAGDIALAGGHHHRYPAGAAGAATSCGGKQSRRPCLLSPAVLAEAVFAGDFGEADL